MRTLITTIDKSSPEYPSDEAIQKFVVLVLASTITSTFSSDEDKDNLDMLYRHRNRDICKQIIAKLERDFDYKFSVYQVRKNRADRSLQDAALWYHITVGDMTFTHELLFKTNLEKEVTIISSRVLPVNDEDPGDLYHLFKNNRAILGDAFVDKTPYGYKMTFRIYRNEDMHTIATESHRFYKDLILKLESLETQPQMEG